MPLPLLGLLAALAHDPAVSAEGRGPGQVGQGTVAATAGKPASDAVPRVATTTPDPPRAVRPVPPGFLPRADWPAPVADRENHLFTLIDLLEFRPKELGTGRDDGFRWDMEGWYGGDYNRLWFKSEGEGDTAFKADYDVDFQLLYGRFIQQYYDFQVGARVETQTYRQSNVTRGLFAIGIEGLVPYDYDVEATLFVAQDGAVSGRLTLTKDLLLTQRLIVQLRLEGNAAVQRVVAFTTGSGLNDLEFGVRLRYEFWREFAPYLGVSVDNSFGDTATLVRQEGGQPSQVRFVAGARLWF